MIDPRVFVRESHHGKGAFASAPFSAGDPIMDFSGPIVSFDQLPVPYDSVDDHFVQIGADLYMGPSGGMDDLVNHSCDPNAGLIIRGRDVRLVAIEDIDAGEEIVWDYSTTMDEDEWELACACGSADCRGIVKDFRHLPAELRRRYARLGIVPAYLERYAE